MNKKILQDRAGVKTDTYYR